MTVGAREHLTHGFSLLGPHMKEEQSTCALPADRSGVLPAKSQLHGRYVSEQGKACRDHASQR